VEPVAHDKALGLVHATRHVFVNNNPGHTLQSHLRVSFPPEIFSFAQRALNTDDPTAHLLNIQSNLRDIPMPPCVGIHEHGEGRGREQKHEEHGDQIDSDQGPGSMDQKTSGWMVQAFYHEHAGGV
jgi:hypothetical protein